MQNVSWQLENELYCTKHCFGVYEHNSTVNSVSVEGWVAQLAIIVSNELLKFVYVSKILELC